MVITYYIGGEPHYLLPNGESITAKQYEALKATTATTTVRHTIKVASVR